MLTGLTRSSLILFTALTPVSVVCAQDADAPPPAREATGNEIIVTAQKREQSLQDVSVAVTAIGGESLAERGIDSLQQIQQVAPAVTFGNDFNQAKVFIRGVGANTSTTGSSTGVALHIDGVYVARAEAQLTSLFDLERVEVLRGPQGTLYGRNAVGGSINLISRKPTADLAVNGRVSFGNYKALNMELGVGGPVTDWLRIRLAGQMEFRDGYGEDPFNGWEVNDLSRQMARAHLQFLLGPDTDLLLTGEYFRQNDNSGAVLYTAPAFPGVARLAPLGLGGFATDPRDLGSDERPRVDTETYSLTATFDQGLTDSLSFTNIANYRKFDTQLIQDLDISAVVNRLPSATTIQTRTINSEQYSNEAQFKYDSALIQGVLGAYYFHERQRPRDQVGLTSFTGMASNALVLATRPVVIDGTPAPVGSVRLAEANALCNFAPSAFPNRVCLRSNLGTEAFALFGQMNVNLGEAFGLEGLTLKLGGRYSHEKVDSRNPSIILTANANPAVSVVLKNTEQATFRERTFKDFTPEIGLTWEPSPDILLYYTYSEGFKAGSGENAAGSTTIVDPESVRNHEVGAKLRLLDRALTLNLAGYTYDLEGLQINKTVGGGPAGFTTIFENAAETEAKGVELDFYFEPVERVRLTGAVSYTDSQYVDFVTIDPLNPVNVAQPGQPAYNPVTNPDPTAFGAPCPADALNAFGPCNIQLAGNRTRNSPKWSYSAHLEVDVFELERSMVTLSGDVYGKSNVYFTEFERLVEGAEAYTMFDAAIRWDDVADGLSLQAYVRNIGDTLRRSSTFALSTGRVIGATYLPPRTYGVALSYSY